MKSNISISFKLLSFMLAVSVLPLLVLQIASYLAILHTATDSAKAHNAQLLEIQRDYLTLQTDQIEALAEDAAWEKEIGRLPVASGTYDGIEASYAALATKTRIGQLLSGYSGIGGLESVDLYAASGVHYHVGERQNGPKEDGTEVTRQMLLASKSPGQTVWLGVDSDRTGPLGSRPILIAVKSIYKSGSGDSKPELLGMVRANFATEYLYDHFKALNLGEGGYFLLLDDRGRMVYHPNKTLIGQPLPSNFAQAIIGAAGSIFVGIGDGDVLLSHLQLTDKKWTLLTVVPHSTVTAPLRAMQLASIALLVASLLVIAWFTRMYLHRVVHPIRDVSNGFRDFQANRLAPDWRLPKPNAWIQVGDLVTWFNAFLDATQLQRQAAHELQASEARNRGLIIAIPDLIFINQRDGRFLDVHAGNAALLLHPPDAILNRTIAELLPAEVANQFIHAIERALDSGDLQELNYSLQIRGQALDFEARLVATSDNTVISLVRDITERRHSEETLRIAATAFESQQGMAITDAQRVILRVNQAFTTITGYSAEEAVGQNPRILSSGRHDGAFYAAMTQGLETTGVWAGEIWNRRKNGELYPEWLTISAVKDGAGVTTHYVAIFNDISERLQAQAQLDTLAFYDPLTQLPNRRLLMDRLEQALQVSTRHARKSALLFVDLDNFKTLNDTLGHFRGDELLVQVAQRLKTCTREGDTVARLGSDEFVVMLEDLSEDDIEAAAQAETVGGQILNAFVPDFSLDSGAHHSTPSIGVTLFGGAAEEGSEQPLKRAELAMFQAKAAGRNRLRFFDARMQDVVSAHAALEADLREAVAKQQFLLHYQPQVVGAGRITGVEALVRWQHPQRGLVSPAEFIPLAEESGLILPIGQWVLETACAQLATWADAPALAHLTVAVNVSAHQFKQPDFVDTVLATLARTGATAKLLKLELTESMLVDDVEAIIAKMGALKAHGIGFSLDDFGTGYSSLSYLKRLPLDQLKIDQGFIRNIVTDSNDSAIAKMVVVLAESLGLSVIAEGVELQAQADFLAHQGCHAYQGYLFSRPLPLEAFEELARYSQLE